ncbi:tetratricopeptide repeat-containing sulfotransferase family protein [Sphingomicrobium nitratireducens]|uniref:tetratricopeptide repeat-containing sulfotransferase family protein n=1 Tax=Sphingomicrobium nitratireducens TaxID=2964666 RepID=UPI00223F0D91|nr:sulfotransferase [Sphingomicrobium nitratireducens]
MVAFVNPIDQMTVQRFRAAFQQLDRDEMIAAGSALAQQARLPDPLWEQLVRDTQMLAEHDLALAMADRWVATIAPSNVIPFFVRAMTLARAGRSKEALAALDALPDDCPNAAANAYNKAVQARIEGDFERSASEFRRSIRANDTSGQAWLGLIETSDDEADARQLLERADLFEGHPNPGERAKYLNAVGQVHHRRGDPAAAFDAFSRSAATMDAIRSFDRDLDDKLCDEAIAFWTRERIEEARRALGDEPTPRPLFVTGLPRTGSTLVEQILAAHSAVDGGEELNLFLQVGEQMGGLAVEDWQRWMAAHGSARPLRDLYLRLMGQRYPGTGRVVDKSLGASRYLGLQLSLFPDAPVVWVRRDPADCAWSVFRTMLPNGAHWSGSLEGVGHYFRNEDRLLDHWTAVAGDRILVVPYRDLVEEPERWIEAIGAHCGLAVEPQQASPHQVERRVTTASAAQVREPINRKGIGVSDPYRDMMGPFFKAYGKDA